MNKDIDIHTLYKIIKNKNTKFGIIKHLKKFGYNIIFNSGYTKPGTITNEDVEIINAVVNMYINE